MWPSKWIRIENESPDLLAACRGLRGEAWSYSTSHGQMLIRFYRDGSLAGIYLYCKGCEFVQFVSSWLDADIKVEVSRGRYGKIFTVTDGERLRIVCGAAFLAESPELVRLEEPKI